MQALALALKAKSLAWSWNTSNCNLTIGCCITLQFEKIKLHAMRKHLWMVSACQYHVTVSVSLLECTTSDRLGSVLMCTTELQSCNVSSSVHYHLDAVMTQMTALGMRVPPLLALCIVLMHCLMSAYWTPATWCMVSHVSLAELTSPSSNAV